MHIYVFEHGGRVVVLEHGGRVAVFAGLDISIQTAAPPHALAKTWCPHV